MAEGGYSVASESEWSTLPASYSHAAHAMVYSPWQGRFLGKYDYKSAVSVSSLALPEH